MSLIRNFTRNTREVVVQGLIRRAPLSDSDRAAAAAFRLTQGYSVPAPNFAAAGLAINPGGNISGQKIGSKMSISGGSI